MSTPEQPLPNTSVCPRCGAGLRCGMLAGDAECWCVKLPNIMPVPAAPDAGSGATNLLPTASPTPDETPPAASCLCPACLKQITDERLNAP
jgi:hypothetical protein